MVKWASEENKNNKLSFLNEWHFEMNTLRDKREKKWKQQKIRTSITDCTIFLSLLFILFQQISGIFISTRRTTDMTRNLIFWKSCFSEKWILMWTPQVLRIQNLPKNVPFAATRPWATTSTQSPAKVARLSSEEMLSKIK
jgi:hypothetical protein